MKKNILSKKVFCMVVLFLVTITNYAQTTVTGNNNTTVTFTDNATEQTSVSISGIPLGATIQDVEIDLAINHTWVGDITIELVAPTGDAITMMNRPGMAPPNTGCCGTNDDLISTSPITFTDTSVNDAELMGAFLSGVCFGD